MRQLILTIFITPATTPFGQNKLDKKVMINGSLSFGKAFLFFLYLIPQSILKVLGLSLGTSNQKRKLFFCDLNDHKSKIYNLDTDQLLGTKINFKIPDTDFFDNLCKSMLCPLYHKKENVIPVYGKPEKRLIKLAAKGQVNLQVVCYKHEF